jgi:GAF domain-containing protein
MTAYRLYFLDAHGAIQARQEFPAENDAQAKLVSDSLWRACDECYPDYELWQEARCLGRGKGSDTIAAAPLPRDDDAVLQARVLELGERLLDSHWRVAQSQQLLAAVEALRRGVGGTVPAPISHQDVVRYVVGKTGAKMMSLQLAEGMRLMLRGSRGFTRLFDEFFSVVKNGREIVVPAIDASPIFARQKALDVLRAEGVASCVSTPLLGSNGRIAGMLSLHRDRVWSPLEGELAQLRHMASNIAAALADPLGAEACRLRAGV